MVSRKHEWLERFDKSMKPKGGLPSVVEDTKKEGLFHNWHRTRAPGMGDYWLDKAIDVACGDYQHPYTQLFLDWSIACSDPTWPYINFLAASYSTQRSTVLSSPHSFR